jgi:hypothetical protein
LDCPSPPVQYLSFSCPIRGIPLGESPNSFEFVSPHGPMSTALESKAGSRRILYLHGARARRLYRMSIQRGAQ